LVSDGAKALVKLAVSGLGCVSLPDVFHLLYAVSKSMGSALARQQVQLQKQLHTLEEKLKADSSDKSVSQVPAQITVLLTQQQILATDHQDYQQSLPRRGKGEGERAQNLELFPTRYKAPVFK